MPTVPVIHATFSDSAAGHLKEALGFPRTSTIMPLRDFLDIGPIDRNHGELRMKWMHEHLGVPLISGAHLDQFWAEVASPANRIVAWVSRRSAREYAGLLALVSQREDRPLDIVDVTDIVFTGDDGQPDPEMSFGIGGVPASQTADLKLAERAVPLSSTLASSYRQTWARLQQENAPLRVVEGGDLVSVPITYFDSQIASCATAEWQTSMAVQQAFHDSAVTAGFEPPGYWFVRARIIAMVASGALEGKGDLELADDPQRIEKSWIRRP